MVKNSLFWGWRLRCKKRLFNHMTVILSKKRSNTNLIFERWHAFEKWKNWPFCKGYSKAKSSKQTYLVAEFRESKIIQKMTLNTHKICFMGKRTQKNTSNLKNDTILHYSCHDFEKWLKWPFCSVKSIVRARRSKMAHLGLNLKVSKHWKNDYRTTFKSFNAKKGLTLKKDKLLEKWWKC